MRAAEFVVEDSAKRNPIELAALDFYKNQVGYVKPQPVDNYGEQARELLQQADPGIRDKVLAALKKANANPYIQGGVITTVGAVLAGGILASAQKMGLTPTQTNIMLQAILNTVIPTMVSRVNGKSWRDTLKYTLASAGIGTGIATMTEDSHSVNADQVLQYVKRAHAPEEFNIEYSITDHPRWELKNIPVSQLKLDPEGEYQDPYNRVNWVDYDKVQELMPNISAVLKRMPIVVDSQGWIIDGNHRATAAAEAGLKTVPAYVPVASSNSSLNESSKSFDRCFDQSCKLYDKAEQQGLNPKLVQVAGFLGDGSSADPRWLKLPQRVWQHYVVIIGNNVLDPTAKQFGPDMLTKYSVNTLDSLWDKQYQIRPKDLDENFADGKVKGKSRPGRVKRAGASCSGSVTDLRAKARKYGGERGKMYHWCANMKGGKKK